VPFFCIFASNMRRILAIIVLAMASWMHVSAGERSVLRYSDPVDGVLAFTISPNPANGTYITVNFNLQPSNAGQVALSVTNLIGQSMYTHIIQQGDIQRGYVRIELADLKLSKGLYFVKMSSGEYSNTQKLVLR